MSDTEPFGGRPVTSTSTRIPGRMNPATPITSFTRTAMARMPDGMIGARPMPLPRGARRPSSNGSSAMIALITERSRTSSTFPNAALGYISTGILTIFTWVGLMASPRGKGSTATTTSFIFGVDAFAEACEET